MICQQDIEAWTLSRSRKFGQRDK